jgi:hypothetical protein
MDRRERAGQRTVRSFQADICDDLPAIYVASHVPS